MFAPRLITLFLSFSTFGLAVASPTPKAALVKRAGSSRDVEAVFITLKSAADSILPQLDSVVASGEASDATVAPLVNELAQALDAASLSLAHIEGPVSTDDGPSKEEIAALTAEVVGDIVLSLDNVQTQTGHQVPTLVFLVIRIDLALKTLLLGVDFLLLGVLTLVSKLLFGLGEIVQGLGFVLFFTLLQLVGI